MKDAGTAVLLTAAGLSSRMGVFKPMIRLGEKTLIEHTLDAFRTAGIAETVIVTGHRHDEIERHLAGRGISFVKNERYAQTDMFDSVKTGLAYLRGRCDRLFVLPADIPLVRPFSIEAMLSAMQSSDIVKPYFKGKSGHPLLIHAGCIPKILAYGGDNGLKGALESVGFGIHALPLPDPGILMDADTPETLEVIRNHYRSLELPSRELALDILAWRDVGDDITRHSIEVAKLSGILAVHALKNGFRMDLSRIEAGALLHDIERKSGRDHAEKGSVLLEKMGFSKVSGIVGAHMELPADALERIDERAIVYLADKLTCGNKRVSIRTRLDAALSRFASNSDAADAVKKRMSDASLIMRRLGLEDRDPDERVSF